MPGYVCVVVRSRIAHCDTSDAPEVGPGGPMVKRTGVSASDTRRVPGSLVEFLRVPQFAAR